MRRISRRQFVAIAGLATAGGWGSSTSRAAEPVWLDRRQDGPFQTAAAFPLAALGDCFDDLGQLERELHRTLALPPARDTVAIFLLDDEASYRAFLYKLYPHAPYRRALYVRRGRRGAVYAYRHGELPIDLRHECTHALLHASLPMVPLWLDEGLAEYFEMPEPQRPFGHPHLPAVRWAARLGMIASLESLEARKNIEDMGPLEYQFAWAWIHFMLHGPIAAHRTLVHYLSEIRAGRAPDSLTAQLKTAMPDANQRIAQHFQHWQRASQEPAGIAMRSNT